MHATALILSLLLAVVFLGSGGGKLAGAKRSLQIRDELHIDARLWSVIGGLEIAGAVGLLVGVAVPVLGVMAAVGLSLLMAGAIAAHGRAGDLRHAVPAAVLMTLAVTFVTIAA